MIDTLHMTARMQQRSLPAGAVELTLDHGDWNNRGDRLTIGQRDLNNLILQLRRMLKDAERLRRRGGATVVLKGKALITTYDGSRRTRR